MTPALKWAVMRAILMFHCEGQSHKTVSTDHNVWRERRAEADSNRGPSAYQRPQRLTVRPNWLSHSSYEEWVFILLSLAVWNPQATRVSNFLSGDGVVITAVLKGGRTYSSSTSVCWCQDVFWGIVVVIVWGCCLLFLSFFLSKAEFS